MSAVCYNCNAVSFAEINFVTSANDYHGQRIKEVAKHAPGKHTACRPKQMELNICTQFQVKEE
jgi:hypothetical protein